MTDAIERGSPLMIGCTRLGLGGAHLGSLNEGNEPHAMRELVTRAAMSGVTFFDTADSYGQGRSEQLIGEGLRGLREGTMVSTKIGYCFGTAGGLASRLAPIIRPVVPLIPSVGQLLRRVRRSSERQDFSTAYLRAGAKASLGRLQTGQVEVLSLHSPPRAVMENAEVLAALRALTAECVTRSIGVSVESLSDAEFAASTEWPQFVQFPLMLTQIDATAEFVRRMRDRGVQTVCRELVRCLPRPPFPPWLEMEAEGPTRVRTYLVRCLVAELKPDVAILGMSSSRSLDLNVAAFRQSPPTPEQSARVRRWLTRTAESQEIAQ